MPLQTAQTPAKVSLLGQYAPLPKAKRAKGAKAKRKADTPDVVAVLVDDPYAIGEPAYPHRTKPGEWIAPTKRPLEIRASRHDPISELYGRGVIDKAMWLAARDYRGVFETAMSIAVRSLDPSAPVVSGGRGADVLDQVADATARLKRLEACVGRALGAETVSLARDVLGRGMAIQRAAQARGEGGRQMVAWWGGTLRRCLEILAESSGYAVRGAYRNRRREEERKERQREQQEQRDRERKRRGKARQRKERT